MAFGDRIKARREELALSRPQLADRLGVTPSTVSNYETGVSFPKEEMMLRLFDCLETDPNTLFQDSFRRDVYKRQPAKPQEGKLQGVPQAAVQPLFSPLHRAGDGGAVHPQLLSNLGHFQSPVVIEEHHLPLPGRQLLLPGPAQAAPQPLQLLTVILRMVPQPDGHVPDPLDVYKRQVLDRAGAEKRATSMDDILTMFNQISLETGN